MKFIMILLMCASAYAGTIGTVEIPNGDLTYTLTIYSVGNDYFAKYVVTNDSTVIHNIGAVGFHISNDVASGSLVGGTWTYYYGKLDGNGGCATSSGGKLLCAEGAPLTINAGATVEWLFKFTLKSGGSFIDEWTIKAQEDVNNNMVGNLMSKYEEPFQTMEAPFLGLLALGLATVGVIKGRT